MPAEPRTGRPVQIATLLMITLATLAIELAIAPPDSAPATVLLAALGVLVAPMLGAAIGFGWRPPRRSLRTQAAELAGIVGLMALPALQGLVLGTGPAARMPLEVVLMAVLRNLGLGLATLVHRPTFARLAALVSLFLILVASAMDDGVLVLGAVGVYAVAGVGWLMLAHWAGLAPALRVGPRRVWPVGTMLVWAGGAAVVVVGAVALGPTRAASVLAEWVASSGGTGETDPAARSGVNDGDNEVAASKDPKSIGFTQSEMYLESDRPSLYDSFSDMYGEPPKPKTKQERMVAMAPTKNQPKEHPTENLHAGRTFPTVRQRPSRPTGQGAERAAQALLYVQGATPVHLGLASYDHFDGATWTEEPHCNQHCPLELIPGAGAWLRLDHVTGGPFTGSEHRHQIKIGTLDSSTLPVPAHVTRLRVGSVNRPDFFEWAQVGLLAMVARTVPAGTVIDTESQTPDPRRLRSIPFQAPIPALDGRYLDVPAALDPAVARLVRSWTEATTRGWGQVEAVVAGVRGHCRHDRRMTPPEATTDVVGWFLGQSRCGPDHHFATATAVALRLLGYPCRVVSGYYAAPGRYDPKTRHTPVTEADVHFWVEVLVPGGIWAAVEPTPGYEMVVPAFSLAEQLAAAWFSGVARLRAQAGSISIGLIAVGLIWAGRRRWLDLGATLAWRLWPVGSPRERAVRTLRLLESRSRRAGVGRPPGRTPSRWYEPIAATAPVEPRAELARLLAIAGWASHAPAGSPCPPSWSEPSIEQTCRRVVGSWTLGRFRACRRSSLPEVSPP